MNWCNIFHSNLLKSHFTIFYRNIDTEQHLHISEHGMVRRGLGKVGLQDGHGASEGHMATSTEQGDAGEAEDCSNQWCIGHSA